MKRWLLLIAALVLSSCGPDDVDAARLGKPLMSSPRLSTSPVNVYACTTCHALDTPTDQINPGAGLVNVLFRPHYWGGDKRRLLDAINTCVVDFMGGAELGAADPRARQIYEYLAELSPQNPSPGVAVTVVRDINDLKAKTGDSARGGRVYDRACARCHGAIHTGAGRLSPRVSRVPDATTAAFPDQPRAAIIEKVRHGRYFGLAGTMPFYSTEVLGEPALLDLLAYLGV